MELALSRRRHSSFCSRNVIWEMFIMFQKNSSLLLDKWYKLVKVQEFIFLVAKWIKHIEETRMTPHLSIRMSFFSSCIWLKICRIALGSKQFTCVAVLKLSFLIVDKMIEIWSPLWSAKLIQIDACATRLNTQRSYQARDVQLRMWQEHTLSFPSSVFTFLRLSALFCFLNFALFMSYGPAYMCV